MLQKVHVLSSVYVVSSLQFKAHQHTKVERMITEDHLNAPLAWAGGGLHSSHVYSVHASSFTTHAALRYDMFGIPELSDVQQANLVHTGH